MSEASSTGWVKAETLLGPSQWAEYQGLARVCVREEGKKIPTAVAAAERAPSTVVVSIESWVTVTMESSVIVFTKAGTVNSNAPISDLSGMCEQASKLLLM